MGTIGKRVYQNINRPAPELVKRFSGIPSSNIGDVMGRLSCTNASIHPLNNTPMVGTAFTVKCPAGDNLLVHRAMDLAKPGDILVIDAGGSMDRAIAGEIMMRYCISRNFAGVVVEGCMRDSEAIREMNFPVYCKGISAQGPYKNGPGEINVPVSIGGQVVLPGDILVGDQDSIAVIHPSDALEVLEALKGKIELETKKIANYKAGNVDYDKHEPLYREQMEKDGFVYL